MDTSSVSSDVTSFLENVIVSTEPTLVTDVLKIFDSASGIGTERPAAAVICLKKKYNSVTDHKYMVHLPILNHHVNSRSNDNI